MSLTERYLRALAAQLPAASRDDIIAELREELADRMQAREAELGRTPSEAEEEEVLREFGHPLVVAARYGSGPQHVVGPELYPWWMFGVKAGLAVLLAITVLTVAVRVITGDAYAGQAIGQGFASLFSGAVTLIGFATLAGFIIERQKERPTFLRDWRVKDLGVFEFGFDTDGVSRALSGEDEPKAGPKVVKIGGGEMSPTAGAVASAIGWTVLLLWWTGVLEIGRITPVDWSVWNGGEAWGERILETTAWLYWPVIAYAGARILFHLARVARPGQVRFTAAGDFLFALAHGAIALWIWLRSPLSSALDADTLVAAIDRGREAIEHGDWSFPTVILMILLVNLLVAGFQALGALGRLFTGQGRP